MTIANPGSVLAMAFELSRGGTYTSDTGKTWRPDEAMRAAGFTDDQIEETHRIARERFGWTGQ